MEKLNYSLINKVLYLFAFLVLLLIFNSLSILDKLGNILVSLTPFYLAFFICWISQPSIDFFERKLNVSKKVASILAVILNILVVLFIILVVIPMLIVQLWDLINNSTNIMNNLNETVNNLITTFNINQESIFNLPFVDEAMDIINAKTPLEILESIDFGYVTNIVSTLLGTFKNTTVVIIQIIFAYIMTFYFIYDFDSFVEKTSSLFFKESKSKNKTVFIDVTKAVFGYLKGLLLVCLVITCFVTLGAWALGIKSPLLFGIIAGLFNIIPYLGPILGGIPLFIMALSHSLTTALLSLIVIFGAQFIESNFLQPKIMAKNTNLHPVTVMVGLIIFQQLFGFVGMFISTPTLAIISVLIKHSKLDIRI